MYVSLSPGGDIRAKTPSARRIICRGRAHKDPNPDWSSHKWSNEQTSAPTNTRLHCTLTKWVPKCHLLRYWHRCQKLSILFSSSASQSVPSICWAERKGEPPPAWGSFQRRQQQQQRHTVRRMTHWDSRSQELPYTCKNLITYSEFVSKDALFIPSPLLLSQWTQQINHNSW